MAAKKPNVWYYKSVFGMLGMLGLPPFNLLAWHFGNRDLRAPGFEQMPWTYRKRVRVSRNLGIVGTVLMVLECILFLVMRVVNASPAR
jgi:hypothetical protein